MKGRILQSAARLMANHPRWLVAIAILYLLSPIDLLPEAFVGPVGYLDDMVVLILPYVVLEWAKRRKPL